MENFDFGKAINLFLVAFVIFMAVMIAFVARLVSTFMVKNKDTNLTTAYATALPPAESPLEIAHSTTVNLTRISENYLISTDEEKQVTYEVLMTIAQARKQAVQTLFSENPSSINSVLFPEDLRSSLPPEAQTFIETTIITEGKFNAVQIPNSSEKQYSMIARNGEEYLLYFTKGLPQTPPNAGVRVRGIRLDNKIAVHLIEEITL